MLGLTQQELADAAGLTRSSVANIEAGRQEMALAVVVAMASNLHTTVGALLGEEPQSQIPGTSITSAWHVTCDKCGPVGFAADHEDARQLRTGHIRHEHLEAS
jgi:transcriptional regulator with XRE-family HTH domain